MKKTVLNVNSIRKYYPVKRGILLNTVGWVKAVDDVSFFVRSGETYGLVGESGCGKTTLARCILRLITHDLGSIEFDDMPWDTLRRNELRRMRLKMQAVFQDPFSSLDPRYSIRYTLQESLRMKYLLSRSESEQRLEELLSMVNLGPNILNIYPHQLSGGMAQRVCIMRAFAVQPRFIILDEAISALDVKTGLHILNLLLELQKKYELGYLFISHDLKAVFRISERIGVMYKGKIVEEADANDLKKHPLHPYTQLLWDSAQFKGDTYSMKNEDAYKEIDGCSFYPRCKYRLDKCKAVVPLLEEISDTHKVACWNYRG